MEIAYTLHTKVGMNVDKHTPSMKMLYSHSLYQKDEADAKQERDALALLNKNKPRMR